MHRARYAPTPLNGLQLMEQLKPVSPLKLIVINTEGCDRLDGADPKRGCAERLLLSCLWVVYRRTETMLA